MILLLRRNHLCQLNKNTVLGTQSLARHEPQKPCSLINRFKTPEVQTQQSFKRNFIPRNYGLRSWMKMTIWTQTRSDLQVLCEEEQRCMDSDNLQSQELKFINMKVLTTDTINRKVSCTQQLVQEKEFLQILRLLSTLPKSSNKLLENHTDRPLSSCQPQLLSELFKVHFVNQNQVPET